jgi:putative tricarboxylic transport membrane protein
VQAATDTPMWKETLNKLGWTAWFLPGDQFKAFVDEDTRRIAAIMESLGLKK